jgi:hypothetical protein
VTVELIRGRYRYRLAHAHRGNVGDGVHVLGEVATVPALERLLARYGPLSLADFVEEPDPG